MSGRVTHGIDSTLLWAARIVGLLILVGLLVLAVKFLAAAFVILAVFVGVIVLGVAMVRRRR